jgi:hypothetical protein
MKAPTLAILLSLVCSPAFAADVGCKSNSALLGQCYVVRGTITVDLGIGAIFNRDDPKSRLIIRPAPGSAITLPENVDHALRFYRVISVHGAYEVCPIPSQSPFEHERFVCVESASSLSLEYQ